MYALCTEQTTLDKKRVKEITCIQRVRKIDALQDMNFEYERSDEDYDNRDVDYDYTAQN